MPLRWRGGEGARLISLGTSLWLHSQGSAHHEEGRCGREELPVSVRNIRIPTAISVASYSLLYPHERLHLLNLMANPFLPRDIT